MFEKFSAIVSLPWNKGQKKIGTEEGAQWLAEYVETELKYPTSEFFVDENVDISTNLHRMYQEIIKHPAPYLFCGGDHSEAISTVLAVVNN
jgi:arginase family enzyme